MEESQVLYRYQRGEAATKANLTTKTQRDLNAFLCVLCAFVVCKNLLKKKFLVTTQAKKNEEMTENEIGIFILFMRFLGWHG